MGENIITIRNLTKTYAGNSFPSLTNIDLDLSTGQIVGLLGPNGSGKTTLIKILNGLLRSYKGEVYIDGHEVDAYTKSIISYLPDSTYLDQNHTVVQVINMFKDLYSDFSEEKMMDLLQKFRIEPKAKIKSLSKGNKEKVQLGLVLSRNAKIYILDEPIGGVDPATRDYIINVILTNYNKDALVIIATHLIEEIESICKTIIFLKEGKIIRVGDKDQLIKEHDKSINELFKEDFKCF